MTDRMLVALGTALLLVGSTCAQPPEAAPPAPPPSLAPVPPPAPAAPSDEWSLADWGLPAPQGQAWASADYLLGWFSGDRLPPLVTTSPAGTPRLQAGVLGFPTTSVLFGNEIVNGDLRYGFRLGGGYWLTPERTLGLEVGAMTLESQSALFDRGSSGNPILARPFINSTTFQPQSVLIAFPCSSAGTIDARDRSGEFYEAHIDLTENVVDAGWFRFDSLLGYRFYRYDEGLRIRQTITSAPNFAAGTVFASGDDFRAQNEFHGGDLGFRTQFLWQDFSLALLTKLGVGCVNRDVKITGGQVIAVPGQTPVASEGGLYALPSNIGNYHSHDWTTLPELGANLGWQPTRGVRVTVGYSILFLNRIARAADQFNEIVNPGLFPGSGQAVSGVNNLFPKFNGVTRNDAWMQSLSLGVEFTY